jgi:REP element-mobilizing transposase RayT
MRSEPHDYLRRLDPAFYRGTAIVHWSHTINDRRTGWLDDEFHSDFREALIHAGFLHGLFCPAYCLMPDHIHLVWSGLGKGSDQLAATSWLRRRVNGLLKRTGEQLQKQPYDRVLREKDRDRFAFETLIAYVFSNPDRAGLIPGEVPRSAWKWRDSILPGYPEVSWQRTPPEVYWDLYWKLYYRCLKVDP